MKKITSLLFCIAIILGCVCPTVTAAGYSVDEELEILNALNITSDLNAETLDSGKVVSRAAFASYVAKMTKANELSENVYFHDVSRDYWAFHVIGALTARGYLSGSNTKFYPDDVIKTTEAVKILLSVMGYDDMASLYGGYPAGYMRIASEIKLLSGCESSEDVTMAKMIKMLVNALDCPTIVTKYGVTNSDFKQDKDNTLLKIYYDMYFDCGTVSGSDTIDITSSVPMREGEVIIDGERYRSEISLVGYLGCEVNYIYQTDKNGERTVVWAAQGRKGNIIETDETYDCAFDENTYTFEYAAQGDAKSRKIKLSQGIVMVYNGSVSLKNINEILNSEHCKVKLVRTKNSSGYDLAIVWSYENYFVGSVNTESRIIYDKNDWTRFVSLDTNLYDDCKITMNGSESSFDQIAEEQVVSVYVSGDGRKMLADISAKTVNGRVEVSTDGSSPKVRINGRDYYPYNKKAGLKCSAGDEVMLYLDSKGYIASVKVLNSSTGSFGYLMAVSYDEFKDEFYVKMMDSNGKVGKYEAASKIRVDGSVAVKSGLETKFSENGKVKRQLIFYKCNANGEITSIDTVQVGAEEDPATTLRVFHEEASRMYKWTGKLGYTILLDDDSKIFAVPTAYDEENAKDYDYMIKNKSNLGNDQYYTCSTYKVGEDNNGVDEVVLIRGYNWNGVSQDSSCILVSDIMQGINSENIGCDVIKGYQGLTEVELTCDTDFSCMASDIERGDLIQVEYLHNGDVKNAIAVYDYSKNTRRIDSDINSSTRIVTSYASDKIGNVLRCGYESGAAFDEVYNLSEVKILVFDSENEREPVRIGTVGDIRTYKMAGENCSTIVAHSNWGGNPISFVVYNR